MEAAAMKAVVVATLITSLSLTRSRTVKKKNGRGVYVFLYQGAKMYCGCGANDVGSRKSLFSPLQSRP